MVPVGAAAVQAAAVVVPAGERGGNRPTEPAGISTANSDRCDFLDESLCLLPFPNDHFTAEAADPAADRAAGYSGRRVNLNLLSMPRNRAGVPINTSDYSRNDGFSPGSLIITKVPGLTSQRAFNRTGAVPITDIARYEDPSQPIVVIDAETGERHPIFSEIDSNPIDAPDDEATNPQRRQPDPEDVNLLIRPAANLKEGHRYIVALRDMRDAGGKLIPARRGFELYRDDIPTDERCDREPPQALRADLPQARQVRDRARQPLPRLGLHRRQRAQPLRAGALDPRRRLRPARRPEPRRHAGPGTRRRSSR